MVQAAGLVNVVVKNTIGYYDDAGAALIGDGNTADDVLAKTATELALAGALVAASDVKIRASDFAVYVTPSDSTDRM